MKPAAEYIDEILDLEVSPERHKLIAAFKEYASQYLDEAARVAMTKMEGVNDDDADMNIYYTAVVDKESVLKLKDKLL